MNFCFEKCIVIGTGQFAFNCAKYLRDVYRLDCVYEYGGYTQSGLKTLCEKGGIPYIKLAAKAECDKRMHDIEGNGKKTLIVSASNIYIFPKFLTESTHIQIVNYHPGLLTRHLGRNAEGWAIYEQDRVAGVTWHEVTSEIDHGLVLAEETITLDEGVTSVRLMMRQYQVGFALFKEFIGRILKDEEIQTVHYTDYGKLHYSFESPNDRVLDLTWKQDKISAFLRSMDYGGLNVMGKPFVVEGGTKYCWDRYKILDNDSEEASFEEGALNHKIIRKENVSFVLQNYHKEDNA